MARIFITGSADGLGHLAAKELVSQGHKVVLHARNEERGQQALKKLPGAENVLTADLSNIEETKALAKKVNAAGHFDAIIHNAGVYRASANLLLPVNTLAPYILTCLIQKPQRLIYLSSGMHMSGDPDLRNFEKPTYSDTKLHDVILPMAIARKWLGVYANAVNPGWVPTKMGGAGAPDNLEKGYETQVWLAISNDAEAKVSGRYFHHKKQARYLSGANEVEVQEKFLKICEQLTGIRFENR